VSFSIFQLKNLERRLDRQVIEWRRSMAKPVPIYRDHGKTYRADSCAPLVDAVRRGKVRLEALSRGHYPGRPLPDGTLPGIKSIGYWDAEEQQDWGLPTHRNEGIEITLLENGRISFAVESQEFTLKPDHLTVTRPWQQHQVGNPHVGRGRLHWVILDVGIRRPNQPWKWPAWLILSQHDMRELTNILRHNEQPVWKASPDLRRSFVAVAHAVESDRAGTHSSRLAVLVNELLIHLLDIFRTQRVPLDPSLSSSRRTVELFLADLAAHPEHVSVNWSVSDMANSCGLGVTQFIHHARVLTNMTPVQYLTHARLELAARLIQECSDRSITDIAMESGFSSAQYFATLFSRKFGCAPRQFKISRYRAAGTSQHILTNVVHQSRETSRLLRARATETVDSRPGRMSSADMRTARS
jgi:AraC family L-rhamnose operon regulatory protein RhaS